MILAPATMAAEKDPKEAARKCLEEVELDPDGYRIGHTKARVTTPRTFLFLSKTVKICCILITLLCTLVRL